LGRFIMCDQKASHLLLSNHFPPFIFSLFTPSVPHLFSLLLGMQMAHPASSLRPCPSYLWSLIENAVILSFLVPATPEAVLSFVFSPCLRTALNVSTAARQPVVAVSCPPFRIPSPPRTPIITFVMPSQLPRFRRNDPFKIADYCYFS